MGNGIIALIAVGSTLVYLAGCGVMHGIGKHRGYDFAWPAPWFGVVLWPCFLPALLTSMAVTRLLKSRTTLPRAEVRRG